MALTLVVEDGTGKANANTFAVPASVTTTLEGVLWADAWAAAAATQDAIVVEASAWISRLAWEGLATYELQALAFPRAYLETPDGYAVASNSIPPWLLQGHARLCLYLAQQSATPFADNGLQPGSVLKVGPLTLTPSTGASLPPDVRALFAPYRRHGNTVVRA